ncbi:putative metal dependent phosphohydrolase protein [Phaeoacremonium minimum UCRPA7]|uniref:Putative metal dependent phosphohydrolase protein n=1 Tax=Phaeoacremonium minimum (strain UCR-PA7) TaxID=1286976 RepID=R8BHF8_PHAM7|nr:putative metal dependent phosphohydrolase protein [Phaeoacremonium minimum UCRPA7]EON98714.1 putative metal dependent phosphohydrolase protein [Phaeoacremonium minimum UCRPA7]
MVILSFIYTGNNQDLADKITEIYLLEIMSSITSTQVLGGITVPKTPAIDAALSYARSHADDRTYNHIVRSFLFGFCIASKLPHLKDRDLEVHAVSAILHDLGWDSTGELISKDKRFEVDGADAARNFLRTLKAEQGGGWDSRRLQLVWDAIALHTTFSIVCYKEPEVVACWMGILADFTGPDNSPGGSLTWDEYNSIVKEYPRLKLITGVKEILCGFCKSKPETTYDNLVGTFGEKYVEGYSLKEHKAVDVFDACPLPDSF